jgi:uncharacterized damage-inducible protein DinB
MRPRASRIPNFIDTDNHKVCLGSDSITTQVQAPKGKEWSKNRKVIKLAVRGGNMSLGEALLPEFDQEMASTRRTLERVPEDKFDWKPHQKSMTLGRLATHLAELPGWAIATVEKESLDLAPPGGVGFQPATARTRKEILALFDANIDAARTAISRAGDAHLVQPWTLLVAGNRIFTRPRLAVLRNSVLNHSIHHRAQLGVYLRLNNLPVPAIYGPSADEK